ncbi:MAG: hypothetical protein U9R38_05080 [Candidatus Margulisiibacteriota bacterium]|nr:hypothetical protein [Candidatus Margulisiibacteriota bacterium]
MSINGRLRRRIILVVLFLFALISFYDVGTAQNVLYEEAIYTKDYALSFFPKYPPDIGETTTLRLRTFAPAQKVTLYSDREVKIPMVYRNGYWWARFKIPKDYQEGGHFFTVWIKHIKFDPKGFKPQWSKSVVWYKSFKKAVPEIMGGEPDARSPLDFIPDEEDELPPLVTGEAIKVTVVSPESSPLLIKGSQSITFKTRSLEGSKEGYVPGTQQTREEILRINISGSAEETSIDATFYKSSALGISYIGENEEKISIRLRRGSTEAFLGDFTAEFTDTEFTRLDKVLSGGWIKGDYGRWGFSSLYSSPKGDAKYDRMYGDGTQGPYKLEFSPLVIDSERVTVDGILQKRGDDYTIDYQSGSIAFIKGVVDPKSIIQVNYDYRQTVYQHATYGLRGFIKPSPNLKVGATYINDSDIVSDGQVVSSAEPVSHYVVGTDLTVVTDNLTADGEIAYSARKLGTEESGIASKFNMASSYGPFGITASLKSVGPHFDKIADPDPKEDVWEYAGGLSYRPNSLFLSQGNYSYQRYLEGGVMYENLYKLGKAKLTPDKFPSLGYVFNETDESNDPVTGSSIRRVITKNSVETIHQAGIFSTSLKGTLEKWLRRSPSEEVTDYRRVNLGLATIGLEKVTFTSNVELENRTEPTGLEPYKRTYNLNLSATPSKNFLFSSSFQIIDDSEDGQTNVTDLSYRAQPHPIFKTDGKYTITSLLDEFATTSEAVSRQSGSFSFDLRPYKYLRMRYLYKPNFTQILRTKTLSYNNDQQQAEINLVPTKVVMLGLIRKLGNNYTVYNNDYPNYTVKEKNEDTNSTLYTLKMAPFQQLSTEINYQIENSFSNTLAATQEPYSYTQGRTDRKTFDVITKTSLSEKFSIDSRYTYQKTDEGSGESTSNVTDTKTHTGSLKGMWNVSDFWAYSVSGSFSRTTDYILSNVIYTISPGVGFIYRVGDKLRVDFDYVHSRSFSGAESEVNDFSLRYKYSISEYVDFTIQAEHEIGRAPDYKLTDITGNLEINL